MFSACLNCIFEKASDRTSERISAKERFTSALVSHLATYLDSPGWLDSISSLASRSASSPDDRLELARRAVLAGWDEVQSARAAQRWDDVLANLANLRKATSTQGKKDNWDPADIETVRAVMTGLRQIYDEHLKFIAEKSRFALDEQVAAQLPTLYRLFDRSLREYQRRKDERQALDFDDLESLAARLLTEQPTVRARWQSELRAVLVDEFQDTNDRQRQIVYALAGFSPLPLGEEPGVRADLFLVGDAKQSIYKFRNADVTVFRQVQADIQTAGGTRLDLDLTFRAHKPLLETLNTLLAPILGEAEDPARPYAVPFAPLQAYRQTPARETIQPPYVEFHLGLGEDAEAGRSAAAQSLARRLRELCDAEGFAWGEMALLFRSSTAFAVYENALEGAGIPFVTVAGRGFYDRPEIRDLLNALAAIADPTDNLALAGLLRSPAFALPDAEIYRLRISPLPAVEGPGVRAFFSPPPDVSRWGRAGEGAQRAYAILSELQTLAGRAPAASVLKHFLDLTGYRAILASLPNGARLVRNVDKLLADAHRSRLISLTDFLAYLQTLRDVGLREGEAPADPSPSGDDATGSRGVVQLMTVHKAKGLEFPLTVLADAAYEHRGAVDKIQVTPDGRLLLDLKDGDIHPTAWQLASRLEDDRDDAEDRRLLYVAATRAREKLLISGHVKRKKGGNLSLTGWLERLGAVIGLDQIQVDGEMSTPQVLPLNLPGCSAVLYPVSTVPAADSPQPASVSTSDSPLPLGAPQGCYAKGQEVRADLLDPIVSSIPAADEKFRANEADPPQRVWRVVSKTKRPQAPAWVVGRLVHEALRRWRFPGDGFEAFLRPFALEAGLTDQAEIHAAIQEAGRLLERFRAHPLYTEIDAAERCHEVPYFLPDERGVIDLLYRTKAGWFIIDFKTDEVRSGDEARTVIRENGYDQQVARYARAVADQLNVQAKTRLVFLNVNNRLAIFDL